MMFIATGILQIIFTLLAVKASVDGNVSQTLLFSALMICEEISGQHQWDRKKREAAHE